MSQSNTANKESGFSPQSRDHSSITIHELKEKLQNCIFFILALLSLTLHL